MVSRDSIRIGMLHESAKLSSRNYFLRKVFSSLSSRPAHSLRTCSISPFHWSQHSWMFIVLDRVSASSCSLTLTRWINCCLSHLLLIIRDTRDVDSANETRAIYRNKRLVIVFSVETFNTDCCCYLM